ncbi:MAG: S26 family signal peptidase [Actinomycetota bacterium]|nr:S26 family signal peptidase [Actinomycetota bacterium]MDQ2957182.1 S26 family signal peptidase [Actinomycetota bacterium]
MNRVVAVAVGLATGGLLLARRCCTLATVRGYSMLPTLSDGQRVLAIRRRRYRVGDIILFWVPVGSGTAGDPDFRVKRVIATAGQPRPALFADSALADLVPARHVAVVGDAPRSEDSRQLGYLPLHNVRGRVAAGPGPLSWSGTAR